MVQGFAKARLNGLLDAQVERGSAGVDVAQIRRSRVIDALCVEPGQQAGEHGGRALQLRHALVGQCLKHVGRIKLAAHEQARARVQRGHEHRAQAKNVRHGQISVRPVRRPQLA